MAVLALLVSGLRIAAPKPETMRDPQANFASYKTFGWTATGNTDANDRHSRCSIAISAKPFAAELQRRGYTEAPAGTAPDLRIAYERPAPRGWRTIQLRIGVGVGSWGGNVGGSINVGSPSVRNYQEGTLVVHAVDTARNAEVWQGRVSNRSPRAASTGRGAAVRRDRDAELPGALAPGKW